MSININRFCSLNVDIPTIRRNGKHWFFVKELYEALGLDQKETKHRHFLAQTEWSQTKSGTANGETATQQLVSESGVYRLLFISRVAEACRFQDWVLNTVIPAIVEDGMYVMGEEHSFPPPQCVFVSAPAIDDSCADAKTFWEHLTSRLLPELRRDGAFFRDIDQIVEEGATPQEMKERVEKIAASKAARRDHMRSTVH